MMSYESWALNKNDLARQEEEEFIKERKADCSTNGFTISAEMENAYRYAFSRAFHCGYIHGYKGGDRDAVNRVRESLGLPYYDSTSGIGG